MSKTFSTMVTNVGYNVQDTSSSMETIIKGYLNNRYFDILRRSNWQAIDDDYSFSLSAAATLVSLPSDFGKEIYVYDSTNKQQIDFISHADLVTDYADTLTSTGTVERYTIIDSINSSGERYKYFKPHYIPTSAITVTMPYTILPLALTTTGGYTVIPCEDAMELGATADSWRYKRQFAKAEDMERQYEKAIAMLLWDRENQPNQIKTFHPAPYDRDGLV